MNFCLRISGSQLEIFDDTALWKYSFFSRKPGGSILYGGNLQTWSLIWLLLNLQLQVIASIAIIILGVISAALGTYSSVKNIAKKLLSSWTIVVCRGYHPIPSMELEMVRCFTYDQNFARTTEFPVDYYYYYSDHNSPLQ